MSNNEEPNLNEPIGCTANLKNQKQQQISLRATVDDFVCECFCSLFQLFSRARTHNYAIFLSARVRSFVPLDQRSRLASLFLSGF